MPIARIGQRAACALVTLGLILAAPSALAIEAFDGRLQAHGFVEAQIRMLDSDFAEEADLSQWYNVFNLELEADILMKATRVDGVYSEDPEKNPHAVLYSDLSFTTVLEQNLRVMDSSAIAHCREHQMPVLVFNFKREGNIERAVSGEKVGTLITP